MRNVLLYLSLFVSLAAIAQSDPHGGPAVVGPAVGVSHTGTINAGAFSLLRLPAQNIGFGKLVEQCPITVGGTYTGLHCQSHDPAKPAIQIKTTEPVIIQNSLIESVGFGITTNDHCNLTLTNNTAIQITSGNASLGGNDFLYANACTSLSVTHNSITGFPIGLLVAGWSGTGPLVIEANKIHRTEDRQSNGERPGKAGLGHAILIVGRYPAGARIAWNHIENLPFEASTEDTINLYNAAGTAAHHIVVAHNFVDGAHGNIGFQFAYSGTGMVTDGDGSTGFVDILNNRVIGFSNNGIAAAIGHDIVISHNDAISTGQIANTDTPGTDAYLRDWLSRFSNDGNNQYLLGGGVNLCAYSATTCYNVTASNNRAAFIGPDGNGVALRTDFIDLAANRGTSVTMTGSTSVSPSSDTSTLSAGSVAIAQALEEPAWMAEYAAANKSPVGADDSIFGSIQGLAAGPVFGTVGSIAGHTGPYLPSSVDSQSLDVYRWSIFMAHPFLPSLCLGAVTQYYGGACLKRDANGNLNVQGLQVQYTLNVGTDSSHLAAQFSMQSNTLYAPTNVFNTLTAQSISTNQASSTGTTCTIAGYLTLTVDGTPRKIAYCQ